MDSSTTVNAGRKLRGLYAGGLVGWIMAIWDLTIMVLLVVPISTLFFPDTVRYMAITATISIYLATSVFRSAGDSYSDVLETFLGEGIRWSFPWLE